MSALLAVTTRRPPVRLFQIKSSLAEIHQKILIFKNTIVEISVADKTYRSRQKEEENW